MTAIDPGILVHQRGMIREAAVRTVPLQSRACRDPREPGAILSAVQSTEHYRLAQRVTVVLSTLGPSLA